MPTIPDKSGPFLIDSQQFWPVFWLIKLICLIINKQLSSLINLISPKMGQAIIGIIGRR